MLNRILLTLMFSFSLSSALFISEIAEGTSNNKYIEIYNSSDQAVSLDDVSLSSCSNGCDVEGDWDYPNNVTFEGATVAAGDVYVVCHGSADDAIQAECDQTFTYLSNGDDVFALTYLDGTIIDMVGDVGDDPGNGWEVCGVADGTKEHTLVRKSSVSAGNEGMWLESAGTNADDCEWIVLDQNDWTMLGFHEMEAMSNEYIVEAGVYYYSPTNLTINVGDTVTWDNVAGFHDVVAYDGSFELPACSAPCIIGSITFDTPGVYEYYCSVGSHEQQGMIGTIIVDDIIVLDCEDESACNFMEPGDCIYPEENFDCDGNCTVDTDCNGVCGGDAVVDECGECGGNGSSCAELVNLFYSEWAEGSSNNKYLEIYNPSETSVSLGAYAMGTVGNAPDVPGEYEYWNTFDDGASVAAGDVFVICHPDADPMIQEECDQTFTYLSNGDDGNCLVFGSEDNYTILDCIGDWEADPGSGWDVAGVTAATANHTIVRKTNVEIGAGYSWVDSAGTNEEDSQWKVYDQNNWDNLGVHQTGIVVCEDEAACNFGEEAACEYADENYDCDGNCTAEIDECGECGGDGSSCAPAANLFFSEYAEGSSNNKYLEIFNAEDEGVNLNGYSLSSCSNGCDEPGAWDYPNNVEFDDYELAPGEVFVVCNPSADELILADCDLTFTYLSNGDDVFALTQVSTGNVLDVIGLVGEDPGNGWDVAGVEDATKDHTLVRKSSVTSGNPLWLDNPDTGEQGSAGDDAEDSEWIVYDIDTWVYLGYHMIDGGGEDCPVSGDVNDDGVLNVLDVVQIVSAIVAGDTDGLDCADMNGDGIINVLDIVQIVSTITGGRVTDATQATIYKTSNGSTFSADGYIGAIQMTLTHDINFEIELTDNAMVAEYNTTDNQTILIVVAPESNNIFSSFGEYEIDELFVVNSSEYIESIIEDSTLNITDPQALKFNLSAAYPNPFNPSTSFSIDVPSAGYLTVKVFNLSGQLVGVLSSGFVNSDTYNFTWDANNMATGMYVINAEFEGQNITHNVSLIK